MRSVFTLFNNLMFMFNSHCIPVTIILKQPAACVSHSDLLQVISKQAAVMDSHSQLILLFGANNFTLFTLASIFTRTILYVKCIPFIDKQFSIDTFLDNRHWVFMTILQITASDLYLLPEKT